MLPRGGYTPLGILACPPDHYRGHAMIPRGVDTTLGILSYPLH